MIRQKNRKEWNSSKYRETICLRIHFSFLKKDCLIICRKFPLCNIKEDCCFFEKLLRDVQEGNGNGEIENSDC